MVNLEKDEVVDAVVTEGYVCIPLNQYTILMNKVEELIISAYDSDHYTLCSQSRDVVNNVIASAKSIALRKK